MWIHLLALELIDGAGPVAAVVTTTTTPGGVRRARFLRRAPKLPWEHDEDPEEQITVAQPRRKRIPLPAARAIRQVAGIPIQTTKEIVAPSITIPELGTAIVQLADDDEDDWLWLI